MSSFIKLEGAYLKLLRYSILVLASVVLIISIGTAVTGLSNIGAFSFSSDKTPSVSSESILQEITLPAPTVTASKDGGVSADALESDLNQEYYARSEKAVKNFVTAYSTGGVTNEQDLIEFFRSRAISYNDQEIISSFAKGMAETLEKVLSNNTIINRAASESAVDIVNQTIDTYRNSFNKELARINEEKAEKEMKVATTKAKGIVMLSVASGAFFAFLLLAFLMIFVKIELNLRDIAAKP